MFNFEVVGKVAWLSSGGVLYMCFPTPWHLQGELGVASYYCESTYHV